METPPYTQVEATSGCILSNSRWIWIASSLVGAMTRHIGSLPYLRLRFARIFSMTGRANAIVLPDPVLERTTTSFPSIRVWKVFTWTGNKDSIPHSLSFALTFFESGTSSRSVLGSAEMSGKERLSPYDSRQTQATSHLVRHLGPSCPRAHLPLLLCVPTAGISLQCAAGRSFADSPGMS
eukprot:746364-Hanusia_phi.AAC.7